MSLHSLTARLRRIEAAQHVGAPHLIVADRPMEDTEAADLTGWLWTGLIERISQD